MIFATVWAAFNAAALLPFVVYLTHRIFRLPPPPHPLFFFRWAQIAAVEAVVNLVFAGWLPAGSCAVSGIVALILWWWSRRKRKLALKELGGKALARLARMLRRMPDLTRRPVPHGV
jgi:hypothetical protein